MYACLDLALDVLFRLQISIRHGDLLYFERAGGNQAGVEKTEAAADGGASVLLCVLAVKQQQERIKGIIPWMQLKTFFSFVILSLPEGRRYILL